MLFAETLSPETTMTLGFVITLVVLGGSIAAGVLTSRLMQGRSIRELEKDVKDIQEWRREAMQQLTALVQRNVIEAEVQKRLSESSSQSTTNGTRPYRKAHS